MKLDDATINRLLGRFEQRESGCWLWRGALNSGGYGVFELTRSPRRAVAAHRLVYSAFVGSIPPGLTLDHLCRIPRCVRPSHLEPTTAATNCQRGARAKLSQDQVDAMRREHAAGRSQAAIGRAYGVHAATVSRIVRGQRWPIDHRPQPQCSSL